MEHGQEWSGDVLISAKLLKTVLSGCVRSVPKKRWSKTPGPASFELVVEGDKVQVIADALSIGGIAESITTTMPAIVGTYPVNMDELFKVGTKGAETISFDPRFLGEVCSVFAKLCTSRPVKVTVPAHGAARTAFVVVSWEVR
jgi:hypothetical protein